MPVITVHALVGMEYRRASITEHIAFNIVHTDASPPIVPIAFGEIRYAPITNNLPIQEPQLAFSGWKSPSFLDDYYYRVHVRPGIIELGNLLSVQVREVELWNAHFAPKLLSSIDQTGADGITLAQPQATPTSFAALESRIYTLNLSTNGSPVINAKYVFNFPSDHPTLSVTGRRVVIWPFIPQTRHKETLEWKTNIIPSFNSEQRLSIRTAPRQSFSYEFQLDTYQFSRAKAIATQWSHRVYGVPVWSELTRIGNLAAGVVEILVNTTEADYRQDDIIIVWESDTKNVAVEIGAILADRVQLKLPLEKSYQNAYVAPLRFSRTFEGISFRRSNSNYSIAGITFQVTQNKDLGAAVGYPQYRGKDVLIDPTILVGNLNERISRATDEFDNGSGPISVDIKSDWVSSAKAITFDLMTRSERWTARKWIHSRRGRQKGFWLPSWNADIIIVENAVATAVSLTIKPIGYPLYYGIKDMMVQLKNGTRIYSRILSASVDANGNEILGLEAPLGTAVNIVDVDFICFMSHVRFNSDRVEINHDYAGRVVATVPVIETPE